ncbi:MAG: NADH-quinone oxidoreductase subunit C [Candidatus Omnitrophota bacterium]|nr:NADH-quinone oxidoreductase subunit C [Candidatus Omnitrophota bacterium]
MSQEEKIKENLISKFSYLDNSINLVRPRRISIEVGLDNFLAVFAYLAKDMQFSHLCTITGLDEQERLGFIYHLAGAGGVMINLKTSVPKAKPLIKSVTAYFPGAEIYERELVDLFGAKVEGLPPGHRYPLTDDWPAGQHPLRKDWRPNPDIGKEAGKDA